MKFDKTSSIPFHYCISTCCNSQSKRDCDIEQLIRKLYIIYLGALVHVGLHYKTLMGFIFLIFTIHSADFLDKCSTPSGKCIGFG